LILNIKYIIRFVKWIAKTISRTTKPTNTSNSPKTQKRCWVKVKSRWKSQWLRRTWPSIQQITKRLCCHFSSFFIGCIMWAFIMSRFINISTVQCLIL